MLIFVFQLRKVRRVSGDSQVAMVVMVKMDDQDNRYVFTGSLTPTCFKPACKNIPSTVHTRDAAE